MLREDAGTHAATDTAPVTCEAEKGGHGRHAVEAFWPASALYVFAGQNAHGRPAAGPKEPGAHAAHAAAEAAPYCAAKEPAGHSEHRVEPSEGEKLPGWHGRHTALPIAGAAVPAVHGAHADAPPGEKAPARHATHTLAPPANTGALPAAQDAAGVDETLGDGSAEGVAEAEGATRKRAMSMRSTTGSGEVMFGSGVGGTLAVITGSGTA
jgi:hypothetical protein